MFKRSILHLFHLWVQQSSYSLSNRINCSHLVDLFSDMMLIDCSLWLCSYRVIGPAIIRLYSSTPDMNIELIDRCLRLSLVSYASKIAQGDNDDSIEVDDKPIPRTSPKSIGYNASPSRSITPNSHRTSLGKLFSQCIRLLA